MFLDLDFWKYKKITLKQSDKQSKNNITFLVCVKG